MEKSLTNSLNEFLKEIDSLDEVLELEDVSKMILKNASSKKELKSKKNEFLKNEFNEKMNIVNEISSFITETIKNNTEID